MSETSGSKTIRATPVLAAPLQTAPSIASSLKMKQCEKIAELREALVKAGMHTLSEQAAVLNLSRSTAWTVLRGNYKASGLSGTIVKRMLASPQLPLEARRRLREYVEEKLAGSFGHSEQCTRRFKIRIGSVRAKP
jgi:hypothetical protein